MIASLPMYDRPETAAAHDALWAGIRDALRDAGIEAPETLDREVGITASWERPDLLLGQTCGLPYRAYLHDRVTLVGAFDYGLPETPPGWYRSVFVARRDDPRAAPEAFADARFAYNEAMSQSGWGSAQAWMASRGLAFAARTPTGGHRLSAAAVAEGRADIAAIDANSWRAIEAHDGLGGRLRAIGTTDATPGLPLITADARRVGPLRAALHRAAATRAAASLGIVAFAPMTPETYLAVPLPPSP